MSLLPDRCCATLGVTAAETGYLPRMVAKLMRHAGLRDWYLHTASMGSVGLCIALWIRAKTVDQDERGNAERRALFVGLWAPTLWLMGDSLTRREQSRARLPFRR